MEINPLRSAKRVAEYRDKWSEDWLTDCRIKGTPSSSISVKKKKKKKEIWNDWAKEQRKNYDWMSVCESKCG